MVKALLLISVGILLVGGCKPSPSSTVAADADRALIDALINSGADLSKPRHVYFHLKFDGDKAAMAARADILRLDLAKAKDFSIEVATNGHVEPEATIVVDMPAISKISGELRQIAAKHGGEYDGWEASAKP